jgi:hypothetical protein
MSDNYIVKTVAGTCISFSFILAGMFSYITAKHNNVTE